MYLFSVFPSFLLSFSLRSRATAHSGQTSLKTVDSSALDVRRSRGRERRRVGKRPRYVSHTEQVLALSSSGVARPRCFQGSPDDPDLHANGTRKTHNTLTQTNTKTGRFGDLLSWKQALCDTKMQNTKHTHANKYNTHTPTNKYKPLTHTNKATHACTTVRDENKL